MAGLSVDRFGVKYSSDRGDIQAVDGVSFDIGENEIFGLVGESGSGKSTLARSIIGLQDENGEINGGTIRYKGSDLTAMSDRELARDIRGKEIGMVFQDPTSSLDPVFTIGSQLTETIERHMDLSKSESRERAVELLTDVGIPSPRERLSDYPHEFSGGMRQRVVIAIALSCNPGLLIADEPTTGLDVSIQAQILDLLREIKDDHDTSILLITHDLGVVSEICDRVAVMYGGNVVELGSVSDIFRRPKHPYTRALLASLPERHASEEDLTAIRGAPPDLTSPPPGCKFHPRCDEVCSEACESGDVPPRYVDGETTVRCYLYDENENSDYAGPTRTVETAEERR